MILNLQLFAKSASQAREYRMAKAKLKYQQEAKSGKSEEKKPAERRSSKGEAVTAVNLHDVYQVFVSENGKEIPYTDNNGNPVYRTGQKIAEKMIYNKNRGAWESKAQINAQKKEGLAKIRKYIIRKRVR